MNRRTFLKGVAAILTAAVSPIGAKATAAVLTPVQPTHAEIEAGMLALYLKIVTMHRKAAQQELFAKLEHDLWTAPAIEVGQ